MADLDVPPWLPPMLALVCAVVAGLTSFGDAILFQILWAAVCTSAWLCHGDVSARGALTRAVVYLTVMPLVNTPVFLWLCRKELLVSLPYGVAMAITGIPFATLGAMLLFSGDLTALKISVGIFFALFAVARLTSALLAAARRRAITQASITPLQLIDTTSIETQPDMTPSLHLFGGYAITSISPHYSVMRTLGTFFTAGTAAGLLGGMFGTSGPPQMIAFELIGCSKDHIRSVAVVYGVLELLTRIVVYSSTENAFDSREWRVYLGIAACSLVGMACGTYVRQFANTDAIIRILLLLVFASSALMLGAQDNLRVTLAFAVVGACWAAAAALLFAYPALAVKLAHHVGDVRQACSRKQAGTEDMQRGTSPTSEAVAVEQEGSL